MTNLPNESNSSGQASVPKAKKKHRALKIVIIVLAVIFALILSAFATLFVMYQKGKNEFKTPAVTIEIPQEIAEDSDYTDIKIDPNLVYLNGKKYRYNDDLITILLLGTDNDDAKQTKQGVGKNGQADAIYLAVLDTEDGNIEIIGISRDSMAQVDVYTEDGFIQTQIMQVSLAYAFGDGDEGSCEMMRKTVSSMMLGIPIHSYLCLEMKAVQVLSTAVDGVSVPEYQDDKMTLTGNMITVSGKDAQQYLRSRSHEDPSGNSVRMERQKAFISAFAEKALEKTKADLSFPLDLLDMVSSYSATDISASQVTYLVSNYLDGIGDLHFCTVPGTVTREGDYSEYHIDSQGLLNLILDIYYDEVD